MLNDYINKMNAEMKRCTCGNKHEEINLHCEIQSGAIDLLPEFLSKNHVSTICLVADENTYNAAGEAICNALSSKDVSVNLSIIKPNSTGDILADQSSVFQLMLDLTSETELIVAVGAGTIHDIVRFVCSKVQIPFISVPTAASVDGFTSAGAPLIIGDTKQTVQAASPIAIFVDLDIITHSPKEMLAAGFGDMIGKYTSLADWKVSNQIANEPFCPLAYRITEESLQSCIYYVNEIAMGNEKGCHFLMEALIKSGLSMLMIGHSRPASGGEHHLSHMWELQHLKAGRPQLLHGAKVGVASVIITGLYHKLAEMEQQGPYSHFHELPNPKQMKEWLYLVGGPNTIQELGFQKESTVIALTQAPDLRDRETGLKKIRNQYPDLFNSVV